jgi:hypothetical protein
MTKNNIDIIGSPRLDCLNILSGNSHKYVYDLYAVCNGVQIHYVYIKNSENKWILTTTLFLL